MKKIYYLNNTYLCCNLEKALCYWIVTRYYNHSIQWEANDLIANTLRELDQEICSSDSSFARSSYMHLYNLSIDAKTYFVIEATQLFTHPDQKLRTLAKKDYAHLQKEEN